MENGPNIRIVGAVPEEVKEATRNKIKKNLFDHAESLDEGEKEALKKQEYSKSKIEIALIDFANQETSRLMQEAGVEPYAIPLDNVHIIPPELFRRIAKVDDAGQAKRITEGIAINADYTRANPVTFGSTVLHEILHLKAHLSMEMQKENEQEHETIYRMGVTVNATVKNILEGRDHSHFKALHEAIVAETEKRLIPRLLAHPELAKEKEWMLSEKAEELKRQIAKEHHIHVDDIIWVEQKEKLKFEAVGYKTQREVLSYVCTEIQKQFPDQFASNDDVSKLFINANFTGRLLPIARLVEKTFGEGSFRLLGNMGTNRESAVLTMDSLKKARIREGKKSIDTV